MSESCSSNTKHNPRNVLAFEQDEKNVAKEKIFSILIQNER
jgi:hypothetical protein